VSTPAVYINLQSVRKRGCVNAPGYFPVLMDTNITA